MDTPNIPRGKALPAHLAPACVPALVHPPACPPMRKGREGRKSVTRALAWFKHGPPSKPWPGQPLTPPAHPSLAATPIQFPPFAQTQLWPQGLSQQGALTPASRFLRAVPAALSHVASMEHQARQVHPDEKAHAQTSGDCYELCGPSYIAQACVTGSEQSHRDTGSLTLFIWRIPNSGDHNVSLGYNLHYQRIGLGPQRGSE